MDSSKVFVDNDFEEIANSDSETNLITKLNTPINILLSALYKRFYERKCKI